MMRGEKIRWVEFDEPAMPPQWAEALRAFSAALSRFAAECARMATEMARAVAQVAVRTLCWQELPFDEARPKKRNVFWRLVCWVMPRRLRRDREGGIGCKNFRGGR